MFGAILKGTNSSFQKGITFCRSIYVKKVMKVLAFIFEQPSYVRRQNGKHFYKGRYVTFKLAQNLKKTTVYLTSYSPSNECHVSILTTLMLRAYTSDIDERIIL